MARTLERSLDLKIRLKTNDEGEVSQIEVETLEPESGTTGSFTFPYSVGEHPEFDEVMGGEIYSWISLWVDQMEEDPDCGDEEEEESFTAFLYDEALPLMSEDLSTYDNKEEAISFAKERGWDEVVNDRTGEVVWKRPEQKNTKISYFYRDGSNYKTYTSVVLEGLLTTDEIASILQTRNDGEFFIPDQVGLPEKRFDELDEQDDHIWFTLPDDAFEPTDCEPTEPITAKELLENFKRVGGDWNEEDANQRLWGC